MKLFGLSLLVGACLLLSTSADLTIVQKVEGVGGGGEMTMKIKGDKMRIEISPEITTIFDGGTGELTNLIFFFQAEDGIRDRDVTGVQTCALPISDYTLA